MKVEIATNSVEKIKGIKNAFSRFFSVSDSEIEFFNLAVKSGVPEQPFNEETYIGALNRVNTLIEKSDGADFYVSCEAGIENFSNIYFNVQVVCIWDNNLKRYLWGKSTGWQIPTEDIERIKKENLDTYLRAKGIQSINELFGNDYSREQAVKQAVELALSTKKLM